FPVPSLCTPLLHMCSMVRGVTDPSSPGHVRVLVLVLVLVSVADACVRAINREAFVLQLLLACANRLAQTVEIERRLSESRKELSFLFPDVMTHVLAQHLDGGAEARIVDCQTVDLCDQL